MSKDKLLKSKESDCPLFKIDQQIQSMNGTLGIEKRKRIRSYGFNDKITHNYSSHEEYKQALTANYNRLFCFQQREFYLKYFKNSSETIKNNINRLFSFLLKNDYYEKLKNY